MSSPPRDGLFLQASCWRSSLELEAVGEPTARLSWESEDGDGLESVAGSNNLNGTALSSPEFPILSILDIFTDADKLLCFFVSWTLYFFNL